MAAHSVPLPRNQSPIPAMASGLVLPTLVHLLAQKTRNVTMASSGVLYSNTLGGVLGVALTGYVMIEAIGVRNALFVLVVAVFVLALYAHRRLPDPGAGWSRPVPAGPVSVSVR